MGRTKGESTELDDKPAGSHVARTDQDDLGNIFRRNMPYGTVTAHGTMFVGFSAEQGPLARMLDSMTGRDGGPRGYYFVPGVAALRSFATEPDEE